MRLRFEVNLLDDGTVVTADGEYLGTWNTDESDTHYEFTPDGSSDVLLTDVFRGPLCRSIKAWHERNLTSDNL